MLLCWPSALNMQALTPVSPLQEFASLVLSAAIARQPATDRVFRLHVGRKHGDRHVLFLPARVPRG